MEKECTDRPGLSGNEAKKEQVKTAPYKSKEAQQVKLAEYVFDYARGNLIADDYSKLHNLESIRRSPPVGWGVKRIQAYFIWAKQVTDSKYPWRNQDSS
jgi:hypothetical protein